MGKVNPQAEELNQVIQNNNPGIYKLLSERGKAAYFPKKGIIKQSAEAKGKRINATIGMAMEDDGSPMRLPSIAEKLSLDPRDTFTYASSYGKPELRKAWQKLIYEKNPSLKSRISMPIVTNALTHGLSMAGFLFVNPGDKILVTDKFWGNYRLIFENAYSGVIETFNTFTEDGFDCTALEAALKSNPGKQILALNFPNNPAGYTPTNDEIDEITDILAENADRGNELVVLIDDAYFGLVFRDNVYRESIFARLADLHANILAVKVDGATKEDYVWGFRVGFVTYAAKGITEAVCTALEEKTGGAVRGSISNASHLGQSLVLAAMASATYGSEKKVKYDLMKTRFEAVNDVLKRNGERYAPYFRALPFNSGYFMCVELDASLDAESVRQDLLENYDTGLIAVGNMLRVAYSAVPAETIPEIFENMYHACGGK
ncbi:aminotransferase class I/II-fold pyridoxal phosphate-dependent enzyme [bacterium]|nr:aminotransferase class I/II-fold pyridoxal phosphate-dependent enzyme [bacterium]